MVRREKQEPRVGSSGTALKDFEADIYLKKVIYLKKLIFIKEFIFEIHTCFYTHNDNE